MTHVVDNTNIEYNLTMGSFSPTATKTTTTLNGTLTLTNTDTYSHILSGTATGFSVHLPDARTLTVGWRYEFFNNSTFSVAVYNNGTSFAYILPNSILNLTLEDNTTYNGNWLRWSVYTGGTASGILHYDASSSTAFTLSTGTADTLITGMTITPAQGGYSIWYQGSIQITGNNTEVRTTLYKAGVLIPESRRTIRSSVSTFYTTHITSSIVTFNGSEEVQVRVARSANSLTVQSRNLLMIRLGDGT